MGAKVGPYLLSPLIDFPLTQCLNPNVHKFFDSVGLTVGANTDRRMSILDGSVRIGCGFVKTRYDAFLSYC